MIAWSGPYFDVEVRSVADEVIIRDRTRHATSA
jgi:hypothetical protein